MNLNGDIKQFRSQTKLLKKSCFGLDLSVANSGYWQFVATIISDKFKAYQTVRTQNKEKHVNTLFQQILGT